MEQELLALKPSQWCCDFQELRAFQQAAAVFTCPWLQVEQEPDEQGRAIAVNYWYDMKFDARQAYLQARPLFTSLPGVICNSCVLGVHVTRVTVQWWAASSRPSSQAAPPARGRGLPGCTTRT